MLKEIDIRTIPGVRIGQAENEDAATGVTAVISPAGMYVGVDVRGGGPASREIELAKTTTSSKLIHGIVIGGGSAFGLAASDGVMQYLEERNIGYNVGVTKVPLVMQADIFDLTLGKSDIRPDKVMGYRACLNSEQNNYRDGNYGAGCGASVGKLMGMNCSMKSGMGSYALQLGDLIVGAIVCVNALGDVHYWKNGQKIAGMTDPSRTRLISAEEYLFKCYEESSAKKSASISNEDGFTGNTTIGIILTNAALDKQRLCRVSAMAQDAFARSIRPVHSSADGDCIFSASVGTVVADTDIVGALAARVMAEAIPQAVTSAKGAYGIPAYQDLIGK